MLSFRTKGFSGYSVRYSPFFDSKIACATAANFGLVGNGRLYILDIGSDGIIRSENQFDTQDGLFSLAWSENHENHVITANGDGSIKLFDITRKLYPLTVFQEHSREVFSVNWNLRDKSMFCSSSWDGTIKIWSPSNKASLQTFVAKSLTPGHLSTIPVIKNKNSTLSSSFSDCIYSAKFSPHEPTLIASAHSDSTIRVWDTRDGSGPKSIIHNAHLGGECLSLDWNKYRHTTLASGGVDRVVKVWDIRNLRSSMNDLTGHDYAVRSVSWSPHTGEELLSTSYDTTAKIWNDASGSNSVHIPRLNHTKGLKGVFNNHSEFVIDCDWSLWGQPGWVSTIGWDEMVYVWKTS